MRLACERRRASEIGIGDRVNGLSAMADAVAPEVYLPRHYVAKTLV